ncbi:hypothetical protein HW555_001235 [Spodoptera exigua]|uniref:Peptidase A2 domain-containing protein n=1 Tax=Spodoptera exigua TaxID=7107 RepID=A0A835GR18_SPOEX|nr:hypothetical protein HW555_001235 [Spodoptera exigua]
MKRNTVSDNGLRFYMDAYYNLLAMKIRYRSLKGLHKLLLKIPLQLLGSISDLEVKWFPESDLIEPSIERSPEAMFQTDFDFMFDIKCILIIIMRSRDVRLTTMVLGVTELISRQEAIFRDLKLICTNYKKDSPTRKNLTYLEERLSRLNNSWEKFVHNHQLLEESGATDLQYFDDDIFNTTKKMYEEVLQDMLKRKSELPSATTSKTEQPPATTKQGMGKSKFTFDDVKFHVPPRQTSDSTEKQQDLLLQQKKLYDDVKRKLQHNIWNNAHYEKSTPKIQIPDFHGNYNLWLTFRDLYIESVHNNPTLSKAQKMQHLKTKLKGEAEKLVQHLSISAENYTSCWEILTHRYDNKRLLFTSYMNTLLNQPSIQYPTATSIRKLHDIMMECLNGLKNIGLDTTNWDPIVVHLLVQKLDSATYNDYIKEIKNPRNVPELEEFAEFLESKFMSLEALQGNSQKSSANRPWKSEKQNHQSHNYKNKTQGSSYFNKSQNAPKTFFTTAKTCPICKTNHVLMNCEKFLAMNISKRNDTVRGLHICKNCLFSHGDKQCKSRKTCKLCHKAHHTLMHDIGETDLSNNKKGTKEENSLSTPSTSYGVNNVTNDGKEVLLTTVLLKVKTIDGNFINLRGLLDQGSQVSLITENAAQRLRLQRRKASAVVSGVGSLSGNCKGAINLECRSIHSDYKFNIEALIMKKLISNLPTASFSISNWQYLDNLKLADPQFNLSSPIDLLLGADIYSELILNGIIRSDERYPVAQQTKVGWILCGNTEEKRSTTSKSKIWRGTTKQNTWLSLVLLSILAITGCARSSPTSNNIQVTPIPNNHPIYFDTAGQIQLIHDEWTLLVYYNLTAYWRATDQIKNYVNQIDKLCKRISHEYTPCETIVDHLRHELNHLTDYNSMLLTQHTRPKRGYFDGVGKLARTLFGVLDVDFAEKYEKDIEKLQSNDDYLLQLMKNQTLIVEAENNIIKRNTVFMNKQFETLHAYMNKTCSDITRIENRAQMLFTINDVNSAAVTSTLILSDLNRISEMLINALANIYRGHLDTHLFPANQLIEQLNIISGRLPQGLSLPVKDIQSELTTIYDLIHVRARITNNYMLFEIHVPLLSDEDYQIYRVIPIPFLRQGQLKIIQPSASFIAINFIKNSFITMEDQDMRQCNSYGEDQFICNLHSPVYNMINKDAPCEAQIFNQQDSVSCILNDVTCKETWTKLHKPNMWLFTLCNKQLMRVICSDQVTPTVINGTGVISLKSKCLLQKKDATIFTHNQLGSSVNMKPEIEVPTIDSVINNIFDLGWKNTNLNISEQQAPTSVEMRKIDQQLEFQKSREILQSASDLSSHDIYHYSVTSLLLGGIAVLAIYIIFKRWYKMKKGVKTLPARTGDAPTGRENFGREIELQEIHSTSAGPIYSEAGPPKKTFHFEDLN